MWSEYDVN
jgi:hypothetical protein